jgi:hypothetical protein
MARQRQEAVKERLVLRQDEEPALDPVLRTKMVVSKLSTTCPSRVRKMRVA